MSDDPRKLEPAEIEKVEAERDKLQAETRESLAKAEIEELKLERDREKREQERVANERHNVYVFDSEVTSASVKKCINQLTTWSRQDEGCEIEIQINSPGGYINEGFALIDFLRELRGKGHKITMVTYGMAASMAGVILQAADVRVAGANAFLLIHEGSLGAIGDVGEVEDKLELMHKYHDLILALFEERAKPINPKTTVKFIRNRWQRKDWWIPAAEAAKLGLVDEVR